MDPQDRRSLGAQVTVWRTGGPGTGIGLLHGQEIIRRPYRQRNLKRKLLLGSEALRVGKDLGHLRGKVPTHFMMSLPAVLPTRFAHSP